MCRHDYDGGASTKLRMPCRRPHSHAETPSKAARHLISANTTKTRNDCSGEFPASSFWAHSTVWENSAIACSISDAVNLAAATASSGSIRSIAALISASAASGLGSKSRRWMASEIRRMAASKWSKLVIVDYPLLVLAAVCLTPMTLSSTNDRRRCGSGWSNTLVPRTPR